MKYALPATLAMAAIAAVAVIQVVPHAANAAPPRTGRACFMADDVGGWRQGPNQTLNLRTSRGEVFTSRLMGVCPDVDWSQRLAIKTRFSNRVCEGDDVEVIVPRSQTGSNFTQTCNVDRLRKLSKEEVDKLEKRYRP